MPKSLTEAQCMVRSKMEDPEVQRERAEVVKAKSVHELSQITSLGDIPIPFARGSSASAVERKKRFREKQRSQSTKNIYEQLQDSIPGSMKSQVLVSCKTTDDPDVLEARRKAAQSKSVQELSQITSLSDFPVPGWLSRSKNDLRSTKGTSRASSKR